MAAPVELEGAALAENTKKRKLSDEETDKTSLNVFQGFRLEKVLRQDHKHKLVTLLGKFADDKEKKDAVVLLERLPFEATQIVEALTSDDSRTKETLKNFIYSTHSVFTPRTIADSKATLIFPATSKHIDKYSDHEAFVVRETPELYRSVTQPCVDASQFSIQWVHNILEKKTEAERIVFEDPNPETGFILLPDMKWNRSDLSSLYLVAIVHQRGLNSLRDLRSDHLPLLRNILEKGKKAILDQFSIPSHQLRIYLHYQPSYTHLHVHFTHLQFEAPGSDCLRAHVLEDVIDNLELDGEFYSKKTLVYTVRDSDALYKAYKASGYFDE
ncbi:m7GpppX diphosphatase-like [Babylonia areolata]|uniref:m7GpppX diphosphatase-like n=1 Tax=Babylonia areolata TaxID=304850 RepID=UPI003FD450AA